MRLPRSNPRRVSRREKPLPPLARGRDDRQGYGQIEQTRYRSEACVGFRTVGWPQRHMIAIVHRPLRGSLSQEPSMAVDQSPESSNAAPPAEPPSRLAFPVIGVGASAGGLEAL